MMNGRLGWTALVVFAAISARAAPQLKPQAELVADGELKAKVLAASQGVPAPTPQSRTYTVTRGAESNQVKCYAPRDLWYQRAFAGEWKDRKGNVMRLGRVKSLVPSFAREDWMKDEIESKLDELEKAFGEPSEETLAAWKSVWGEDGVGQFVVAKNGARYYVQFVFKENVKDTDAEKLLKVFEKSVSTNVRGGGNISSMKWWERNDPQYRFLTDLDKAKGGKFIDVAMKLMGAMRKSYEFYVPPQKAVGVSTVRVFKTTDGYRDYLTSTGADELWSFGLWDPSREELLICAEDPALAPEVMRHEAFHQYLFYATGNGRHARWFDEGHAAFFEGIQHHAAKNTVKIVDSGRRARETAENPERVAAHIPRILKMNRDQFYSGDLHLNYRTAWALVYFLEKGAYAADEFEPYRGICAKYLTLTAGGTDAASATAQAWSAVAARDVSADFLKFWTKYRKPALNAR
jgi:hypothetical protein